MIVTLRSSYSFPITFPSRRSCSCHCALHMWRETDLHIGFSSVEVSICHPPGDASNARVNSRDTGRRAEYCEIREAHKVVPGMAPSAPAGPLGNLLSATLVMFSTNRQQR